MKLEMWVIGKTNARYLEEGIELYEKRVKKYLPFELQVLPDVKNAGVLSALQLKEKEGEMVISRLKKDDFLILLDEKGQQFTSEQLAQQLDQWLMISAKRLVLLVGGAYGFSDDVYAKAQAKLALSKMTFSHQMVRLFLLEQLYRAMSILRNEPYHNA